MSSAAAAASAPAPAPPPSSMADALSSSSPSDALRSLSDASEAVAARLAEELTASLRSASASAAAGGGGGGSATAAASSAATSGDGSKPQQPRRGSGGTKPSQQQQQQKYAERRYPIPLPESLRTFADEKRRQGQRRQQQSSSAPSARRRHHHHHRGHRGRDDEDPSPLSTALASSASILSSLTKVASGGSRASREMRDLEDRRRALDEEADDVADALRLRRLAAAGADALGARRYADAAAAVRDYRAVRPTERAAAMAGEHTAGGYERTRDVLQRSVLERYEGAVASGDVAGLSELTPLLGMLDLADRGVGLYLRYSQSELGRRMSLETEEEAEEEQRRIAEEEAAGVRISRAEARRREERRGPPVTACTKLAKVYNAAVTHLRHHLPMVAFALGEADGDAALVQLVHLEAERRAVPLIREYADGRDLAGLEQRAEAVANRIEDRYVGGAGDGTFGIPGGDDLWAAMGLGSVGGGHGHHGGHHHGGDKRSGSAPPSGNLAGNLAGGDPAKSVHPADDASVDDCGFRAEVGALPSVDAAMDETALLLQHTESYERFVRHAVDEVNKARELRRGQKLDELRRRREAEERRTLERGAGAGGGSAAESARRERDLEEERELEARGTRTLEILPPHTPLNEVVAEVGGYYSGLERCLLLASMQRAFLGASRPDGSSFAPLAILDATSTDAAGAPAPRHPDAPGALALQTSVVEECLYAAQRSTLRAFATGHTGTAAAAANFCADTLGRVLLEVLTRRAEWGTSLLRPGDGLLVGQGGLGQVGQAALAVMRGAAEKIPAGRGKGPGGVGGVVIPGVVGGGTKHHHADKTDLDDEEERALVRRRIEAGIARACANLNDLEVAADYTRRLESKFLSEIGTAYPRGHETEQLRMCVRSLGPATESFRRASDRTVEQLVGTVMPRVRSAVSDAVGQESTTSTSFSTAFGNVAGGKGGAAKVTGSVRMNYGLDDDAYELAQVSEGYMTRLCAALDETVRPLRSHLAPRLSDAVLLGVLGGASKRVEAAVRRTKFTALGALALDSDVRHLVGYGKERVSDSSPELTASNVALYRACKPLARLAQIASLMNVDDLDDVLDLISSSKRKGNWDLTLDDAKAFLNLRVDFEGRKVNELLRISEEE